MVKINKFLLLSISDLLKNEINDDTVYFINLFDLKKN